MDNNEWLYYFAYGANTNPKVFNRRRMRPASCERAVLKDHVLQFNQPGWPLVEPAFGNIGVQDGAIVHGVLYKLRADDFNLLNIAEGNGAYRRKQTTVQGAVTGDVSAWVFWTDRVGIDLVPSRRYIKLLMNGAKHHNFPPEWVGWLAAHPSAYVPLVSELVEYFISPFIMFWFRAGFNPPFQGWRRRQIEKAKKNLSG